MPKLSVTNSTGGDITIQDTTGKTSFEVKIPASTTKSNVKVSDALLSDLEPQLNALLAGSKITWSALPDLADPAESAIGARTTRSYFGLGNNGVGHVTLASAKVGDLVISAIDMTSLADVTASFEAAVTVAGQIQQSAVTDLSAKKIQILLQVQS